MLTDFVLPDMYSHISIIASFSMIGEKEYGHLLKIDLITNLLTLIY